MKNFFLISSLLFAASIPLSSQTVPEFEMKLYFEDAIGNKDTVEVGYQRGFSDETPYDGPILNTPLDSVFEVRVLNPFNLGNVSPSNELFKKRIISGYELFQGEDCGNGIVMIVISCKYPPLTMRYDSTLFAGDACRGSSFLTPDWQAFLLQFWWDTPNYYCMAASSSIQPDISMPSGFIAVENVEVEGQSTPTNMPGLMLSYHPYGPCLTTGTSEARKNNLTISIAPNPAYDVSTVRWESGNAERTQITVRNILGQEALSMEQRAVVGLNTAVLETARLMPGHYFVVVESAGSRGASHLVVAE